MRSTSIERVVSLPDMPRPCGHSLAVYFYPMCKHLRRKPATMEQSFTSLGHALTMLLSLELEVTQMHPSGGPWGLAYFSQRRHFGWEQTERNYVITCF